VTLGTALSGSIITLSHARQTAGSPQIRPGIFFELRKAARPFGRTGRCAMLLTPAEHTDTWQEWVALDKERAIRADADRGRHQDDRGDQVCQRGA
jgi:hypothetical protein